MLKIVQAVFMVTMAVQMVMAEGQTLEMRNLGNRQLYSAGFELNSDRTIHIKAIGAGGEHKLKRRHNYQEDPQNFFAYAWILDAATRKMVWRMTTDNTKRSGWSEWNRVFNGDVELKKGRYEVYFAAIEPSLFNGGFISFGKLLKHFFIKSDEWDEASDEWIVKISDVDNVFSEKEVRKLRRALKQDAIIQLTNLHDDDRAHKGFSLTKDVAVRIYALGEGYNGQMFDYGWIVNADTREKVWSMHEEESEDAGGARKNRLFREKITLPAGDYLIYYRLDDSHSPEEWNANPPYDPYFWGITVFPAEADFDHSLVKKYVEKRVKPVVSIVRVGDYAYKEEGLKITRPTKIHIHALGEGRDGEMFDYGWISRVDDGSIVWKMRFDETEHAGGAAKNRVYDGVITLQPGEYIVHYQTDDSHSYEEWNAREPDNPEDWGITIYPLKSGQNAVTRLKKIKTAKNNIVAQLIRVGDDEHVRKQFTLDKTTRLHIYCIGEGDEDEMYDYGWIENVNEHRTVWKMRYRNTVRAGGAAKNRLADTIITLPPGTYRVHFRSDDSHSYRHWNEQPPDDRQNWGITIYRIK